MGMMKIEVRDMNNPHKRYGLMEINERTYNEEYARFRVVQLARVEDYDDPEDFAEDKELDVLETVQYEIIVPIATIDWADPNKPRTKALAVDAYTAEAMLSLPGFTPDKEETVQ